MQATQPKETTPQARRSANRNALRQAMDAQLRSVRQASRRRALRALQAHEARSGDAPVRAPRGTRGNGGNGGNAGNAGTPGTRNGTRAGTGTVTRTGSASAGRAAASGLRVTRARAKAPAELRAARAAIRPARRVSASRSATTSAAKAAATADRVRARRTHAAPASAHDAAVIGAQDVCPTPAQAETPRARRRRLPRIDTAIIEMGSLHARVTALDLPPRPRIARPLPAEQELVSLHRRDWFRILADLQVRGWSNADVSRMLGISDTTVRNWKYGIEPGHARGEALLELHKVALRRKRRVRGGRWGNTGLKGAIGGAKRERLRSPQGKRAQLRAEG